MNRQKIVRSKLNQWRCFRCNPHLMHMMLKDADIILTRQLNVFMSRLQRSCSKYFIDMDEYKDETYNIQSGLLLLDSNKIDTRITHKGDLYMYSSSTPLQKEYKTINNIHIHDNYSLELRDRIHLTSYQIESIKFLYDRVIHPIEDWHKNIQSGTGDSCALAHEDCLERRRTVAVFLKALLNSKYSGNTKILIVIDRRTAASWTHDLQFFMTESMFTSKSVFCNGYYRKFKLEPDFTGWGEIWNIAFIDYFQYITEITRSGSILRNVDGPTITIFDSFDILIEKCPYFGICAHQIYTKKKIFLSHSQIYPEDTLASIHSVNDLVFSRNSWKILVESRLIKSLRIKNIRPLLKELSKLNISDGENAALVDPKIFYIVRQLAHDIPRFIQQQSIKLVKSKLSKIFEFQAFVGLTRFQLEMYNIILKYLLENKLLLSCNLSFLRRILLHPSTLVLDPNVQIKHTNIRKMVKNNSLLDEADPRELSHDCKKTIPHSIVANCISHFKNIRDKMWSSKVEFLMRILNICSVSNLKVAVFSKEESFFDYIEATIANLFQISLRGSRTSMFSCGVNRWKNGINYYRIKAPRLNFREKSFINNFNNDQMPMAALCLVHVSTNMPDLNLKGAGVVVCMEPMSEHHYLRCLTSSYRASQKNPVTVVTMVSKDTFEEYMIENKQNDFDDISIDWNSELLERITPKSHIDISTILPTWNEPRFPNDHFLSKIKISQCGVDRILPMNTYE